MDKKLNIEPLNGKNYHNWKFRVEMLLAEYDVSAMIQSKVNTTVPAELKKDNKAKSILVQCVEDTEIESLRDCKSVFQMWNVLKGKYEKKGLPGQLYLKRKLLSMKLKENKSPIKFLEEFENTVRQLKAADVKLEDQNLICNLLLSLPPSYETFVTVIENLSDVTYKTVKSKLLAEDEKRRMGNGE